MKTLDKSIFIAIFLLIVSMLCGMWSAVYSDNVPPSQNPPGGIVVEQAPMFVSIGFDDNQHSGLHMFKDQAMKWVVDYSRDKTNPEGIGQAATYDEAPVRFSFFSNSCYISDNASDYKTILKWMLHRAYMDGQEIGNHSHSHPHGESLSESAWESEIDKCNEWFSKPAPAPEDSLSQASNDNEGAGIPKEEMVGFRTPFLEYGDATFSALKSVGMTYDCSIEDGYQSDHDGTNYYWPYTLDNGSPGHDYLVEMGLKNFPVGNHPGLWELPVHPIIVPPDDQCEKYGVPSGLREKMHTVISWFDPEDGKITGFDYNVWYSFRMTKLEFLATLKYTLDLRMQGNRAPFMLGSHTFYYSEGWNGGFNANLQERQETIEEFIEYALSKPEVRVVSFKDIVAWCHNPIPLNGITSVVKKQNTIMPYAQISANNRNIRIQFNREFSGRNINILIFNLKGRIVDNTELRINSENSAEWKIKDNLCAGIYLIHVIHIKGNVTLVKKISLNSGNFK